jgi:polyhydroxybutyrate depolymerase
VKGTIAILCLCLNLFLLLGTPGLPQEESKQEADPIELLREAIEPETPPGMIHGSIESGGLTRHYYVHLPPNYKKNRSVPLILAFHGGLGRPSGMAKISRLNELADEKGLIIVYPEGDNRHWQDGRNFKEKGSIDDVAFIADLLSKLSRSYAIDRKRVYGTGISNGGFFAQRLACEMPDKLAAVASIAATRLMGMSYGPRRAVPIMFVLGTEDPLVPWKGGFVATRFQESAPLYSGDQTIAFWIKYNQCSSAPKVLADLKPGDGTHCLVQSYSPLQGTGEVVLAKVEAGGHCWPGGPQYLPRFLVGKASTANVNQLIYAFFTRHHL